MSSMAVDNPQMSSGLGGATPIGAPNLGGGINPSAGAAPTPLFTPNLGGSLGGVDPAHIAALAQAGLGGTIQGQGQAPVAPSAPIASPDAIQGGVINGFQPPAMTAGQIGAPANDNPNFYVAPVNALGVPQNDGLPLNMQIPTNGAPLGAFTDDQYMAADSALRAQLGQQYATILQQLGYQDPNTGNTIPGTVVQDANIQLAQQQEAAQQALQKVVQDAQNNGTLFSGIRQTNTQQALSPIQQNEAQINLTTSRNLDQLYQQAQQLVQNYNTQNQKNLADAADRNLAAIQQNALIAAMLGGGGSNNPPPNPTSENSSGAPGTGGGAAAPASTSLPQPTPGGPGYPVPLADVLGGVPVSSQGFGSAPSNTLGAIANAAAYQASNGAPLSGYSQQSNANLH